MAGRCFATDWNSILDDFLCKLGVTVPDNSESVEDRFLLLGGEGVETRRCFGLATKYCLIRCITARFALVAVAVMPSCAADSIRGFLTECSLSNRFSSSLSIAAPPKGRQSHWKRDWADSFNDRLPDMEPDLCSIA